MVDFNLGIKKKEYFCEKNGNRDESTIHIAFGIDQNFAAQMGVTMTSIVEQNLSENFAFHIFANSIMENDVARLKEFANKYSIEIYLYYIDIGKVEEIFKVSWRAVYNRFFAAKCLGNISERVLYLDADMVCMGSIKELTQLNFDENIAMVVADQGNVDGYIKDLNLKSKKYFNAGMLYINIDLWNKNEISERSMKMLQEKNLFLLDQDALNILLDEHVKYLPKKWNNMCNMEKRRSKILDDAVIVHYVSINKPWHIWCFHPAKDKWMLYLKKSLWSDIVFSDNPRNYREMRMMGAFMIYKGKYIEALRWYWRYFKKKLKK